MGMFLQKMAIWPLELSRNAVFSKIVAKPIYFWLYSIKASYLEYTVHCAYIILHIKGVRGCTRVYAKVNVGL